MSKPNQITLGQRRWLVLGAVAVGCIFWLVAYDEGPVSHLDHQVFLDTIESMHEGEDFYDAYEASFAELDVELGKARAYRMPTPFLAWRWVPMDLLFPFFLAVCVIGAAAPLAWSTRWPEVAFVVALYPLLTGRIPSDPVNETWLLVEYWSVTALLWSLLAHRRGRDGWAAAAAALAVLIRELAAPVLVVGAVIAIWRRRPIRPWIAAMLVSGLGFAAHTAIAAGRSDVEGNSAVLAGTGRGFETFANMAGWLLPGGDIPWVLLWMISVAVAFWRPEPVAGVLPVILTGFFVARPYWGLMTIPVSVFLVAEALCEWIAKRRGVQPAEQDMRPEPLLSSC